MRKFSSLLLSVLFMGTTAFAQQKAATPTLSAPVATTTTGPVLIEKIEKKDGEIVIPYEKWKLPNGLIVFLHEDHSDPIVHVNVTYRVGSNREVAGRTGFAHFFEHMMFQGSDHIADEEHIKIVESVGGDMNGTTDRDRTNYFETMPSNYLETALWLESDRMGFLLDAVTKKKFESQRDAVKNEKGQGINAPYGRVEELVASNLYPQGHPYSWTTIGYLEDLNAATVQDLKNFFLRWYGPNNAILTVAGDINPQETLKLIEKYFGNINRGPEVKKLRVDPFYLPDDRYASYTDRVYIPLFQVVYPSVKNYDADEPALDLLASILGNGNSSPFYKNLVKTERALQASVFNPCGELGGEFTIQIAGNYGTPLDSVKVWLTETFGQFEKAGISDDQLQRAKAMMEAQLIGGFESIAGRASQLASWEYLVGRTWNIGDELKRYNKVTKEDIMRVYNKYIKGRNKLIVSVYPAIPGVENEEYKEPKVTGGSMNTPAEYNGLVYNKPKDNFDRSKRPVAGPAKLPVVPKYYTSKFDNGLKLIGTQSNEQPVVTMILRLEGGHLLDAEGKHGTAVITADMMNEATKNFTSEAMSDELDKLGSSISFSADQMSTTIVVRCLKKNSAATLKLLEEKLMNPKFSEDDFKRLKKQMQQLVKQQNSSAGYMAQTAFRMLMLGNNVYGTPALGTEKSIKAIELKDVQAYYSSFYSPAMASVTVVGDIAEQEVMTQLGFLKSWAGKTYTIPALPATPQYEATQIYMMDKPGAPQSQIRIGIMAMAYDYNGDYYRGRLTNYMLGGAFNSRINLNLREDKGYSYGCYSSFQANKYYGTFSAGGSVRTNATDSALTEFFKEIKNYREGGITNDDVKNTQSSIILGEALDYETSFQKAGFLSQILLYNLPADYNAQQNQILSNITRDNMLAIAKKYLVLEKMIVVVVGDKAKIKKPVSNLNLGKIIDYKLE